MPIKVSMIWMITSGKSNSTFCQYMVEREDSSLTLEPAFEHDPKQDPSTSLLHNLSLKIHVNAVILLSLHSPK